MLRPTVLWAVALAVVFHAGATCSRPLEHPPLGAGLSSTIPSSTLPLDIAPSLALAGDDTLRTHESYVAKHRLARTWLEVIFLNRMQWVFNRYIVRSGEAVDQFKIGWDTISENMKNGFEWDDNQFHTNHFAHPYNGAMYFGAARANDYTFYESILFAALGSAGWEYAGENNHPAVNDWINTTYGGMSFGESLFRLSTLVLDNRATGFSRVMHEIGGGILSPGRFVNRIATGEAWQVHQDPGGHVPEHLGGAFKAGARAIGNDHIWKDNETTAFLALGINYGDPFGEALEKPFDTFNFDFQMNIGGASDDSTDVIAQIDAEGWLFGQNQYDADGVGSFWAAYSHFNYYSNEVFKYGSQEFGAAYLDRYKLGEKYHASSAVHLNAILLGAAYSDYTNISGRDYDYGPGLAAEFQWTLERGQHPLLYFEQDAAWIHAIDGNIADHFIFMTDVRFEVPIHTYFKLGVEYLFYAANRNYKDYPDVNVSAPELRLSAAFDVD
jgi:hypothetical protein